MLGLAAGLTLVLLLSTAALPALASGGGIKVMEDRWEIKFPGHVAFDLTAEADQQVVEVRLFYRLAGSPIWAYAYPDFEPARRVAASFNLKTGGAGFLLPFTRLEYYYVIRDAQGNVYKTPPTALEYADTRFQWQQTRIGPLVLMHHDLQPSRVTEVSQKVKVDLQRLSELLQVDTGRPIKGIIYNQRSAAEDAFPRQSRTITEQHVFEGFAFPQRGLFVGLGLQPRLIIHESAHLLLHQTLGPDALPVPAWLDEGFASYVEPGSAPYSGESLSSLGLPLEAMSTIPGTPRAIGTFYLKAESVVAYLVEEHGAEPFQDFLGQLRAGHPVGEALAATYGFDIPGLEALWAANAGGLPAPAPGSPGRPSPFLYFDSWTIGALALGVMAVLLVRYGIGKLRANSEPGEGLQPWEDPDLLDRHWDDDNPP
jgi:hypothetical protein